MRKKLFAAVICLALLITLLPATALAAGESAIQLGTGGIDNDDKVYFAKYTDRNNNTNEIPWRVLQTSATSAFLLSEYLLGTSVFRVQGNGPYYPDSTLQGAMAAIYNAFDSKEKFLIQATALEKSTMASGLK